MHVREKVKYNGQSFKFPFLNITESVWDISDRTDKLDDSKIFRI